MCLDEDNAGGVKMQANQKAVIITSVVASIILAIILIGGFVSVSNNFGNKLDVLNQKLEGLNVDEQAIANAIVAGITLPEWEVPEFPEFPDTEKLDRVCELTEGCEYWEGDVSDLLALDNGDAEEDFFDAMVDLTGIDEDYLRVQARWNIEMKDYQVRAYSDNDEEDENWEIKTFIKVRYYDEDEADGFDHEDAEYEYLVVTSVLDEGEYDSMTVEEVNRRFEF